MICESVRCRTRITGPTGARYESSTDYGMGRGGCQGTTSMPRIFIVAMHYVYVKHDPERLDRLYGPAEASDRARASKCLAHQIRRSVPVMAAPVMVLELMLRQAAAAIDKAGGYRACAYSPRAQPSLVGSTCTVGEPAPPATP